MAVRLEAQGRRALAACLVHWIARVLDARHVKSLLHYQPHDVASKASDWVIEDEEARGPSRRRSKPLSLSLLNATRGAE